MIIILLIITGIIGYSIINKNKEKKNSEMKTLKVNEVTRSVFYAPQYVAIANGYFKDKNLNIELTTGQGADKVMTAILAGQSNIGFARARSCDICI